MAYIFMSYCFFILNVLKRTLSKILNIKNIKIIIQIIDKNTLIKILNLNNTWAGAVIYNSALKIIKTRIQKIAAKHKVS